MPTSTLYKVYSTPGSIQLSTCRSCGHDVDPYIEREWLLVIMDCVLHRPEAFRHVLYNREPFCDFKWSFESCTDQQITEKKHDGDDNASSSSASSQNSNLQHFKKLIRYTAISSLLRIYIWYVINDGKMEAAGEHVNNQGSGDGIAKESLTVALEALLGEVILILATILSSVIVAQQVGSRIEGNNAKPNKSKAPKMMDRDFSTFFHSRMYLALTLSSFFHIVTIFVLIWEKSLTVCSLGTLFVLSLQRMGIATVLNEQTCRVKDRPHGKMQQNDFAAWLKHSFPFIAGLFARTLFIHLTRTFIERSMGVNSLLCTGIPIPLYMFLQPGELCIV